MSDPKTDAFLTPRQESLVLCEALLAAVDVSPLTRVAFSIGLRAHARGIAAAIEADLLDSTGRNLRNYLLTNGLREAMGDQGPLANMRLEYTMRGGISTFGGPADSGVSAVEGLALLEPGQASMPPFRALFLADPLKCQGLARNLDPEAFYCAMRFDYFKTSKARLRSGLVEVVASNGKRVLCRPVDWGPNARLARVVDVSPGALRKLGVGTDAQVDASLWLPA